MSDLVLLLTVFLACTVEAVEALTIVLAAGTSRHWGSALQGTVAALLALAATVAALGPAIGLIPLGTLRLVVGALLLVFGLQWLRKAILRASGHKALHDETTAYTKQVAAAGKAQAGGRGQVRDWYAFTLASKGVFLEGLEVAFIVVTFGNNQRDLPLAAIGAAAAVLAVTGVGFAVRAPLARVPENTMKFAVGVMLTSFGTFWSVEGTGAHWPGSDATLLALIPAVALLATGCTVLLRRGSSPLPPSTSTGGIPMEGTS
ncbi:COG4280 domain-containing protein [Streptacidiphilus sp. PB12-B1b]|uniref:COG4280 domain-containing protein n=1 Tax=Streptacidiphilus sp. PB12-B1b TaxID=2705012 RepID=UPI0015F83644|nr:TMEM165/GDT1 family protein [Streptacidiphilus sp. PB12-B1b]